MHCISFASSMHLSLCLSFLHWEFRFILHLIGRLGKGDPSSCGALPLLSLTPAYVSTLPTTYTLLIPSIYLSLSLWWWERWMMMMIFMDFLPLSHMPFCLLSIMPHFPHCTVPALPFVMPTCHACLLYPNPFPFYHTFSLFCGNVFFSTVYVFTLPLDACLFLPPTTCLHTLHAYFSQFLKQNNLVASRLMHDWVCGLDRQDQGPERHAFWGGLDVAVWHLFSSSSSLSPLPIW